MQLGLWLRFSIYFPILFLSPFPFLGLFPMPTCFAESSPADAKGESQKFEAPKVEITPPSSLERFEKGTSWPRLDSVNGSGPLGATPQVQVDESVPRNPEVNITSKKSRPIIRGERETEGTKAPHQIEGDPVLRSHYKSETGELFEVDPD